jgi:hypothetical protein
MTTARVSQKDFTRKWESEVTNSKVVKTLMGSFHSYIDSSPSDFERGYVAALLILELLAPSRKRAHRPRARARGRRKSAH